MPGRTSTLLAPYARRGVPIVGSEPSCILTLRDEYVDLIPNDHDTSEVASQAFMIDEFLAKHLESDDLGIEWRDDQRSVFFHGHCHQKALIGSRPVDASAATRRPHGPRIRRRLLRHGRLLRL